MKASTLGCPAVDPPSTPERIASGHSDDPFEHTQIQTHKNTNTQHLQTQAQKHSKGLTQVNTNSRWIILSVFESMLTNPSAWAWRGKNICCQL